MLMVWGESMNFKVLNGDIYFPDEFVKLNEIRTEFLQLAFNSVSTFTEECTKEFNSIEQLLKDGESFGYEYLNSYISKAIDILNEFGIKEIDNDIFLMMIAREEALIYFNIKIYIIYNNLFFY